MIGREYTVEVRQGGRVSLRRVLAVSPAHAREIALRDFPREVGVFHLCPACIGATGELDEACEVCGGIESERWGIDPSSFAGCCVEVGPGHEHPERAHN